MDNIEVLEIARAEFESRLVTVENQHWDVLTPADEWVVRDLVAHIVGGNEMAVHLLAGCSAEEAAEAIAGADIGGDPVAAFRASADAQMNAFAAPGALTRTVHHPIGDVTGDQLLGFRIMDLTLHAWDLARAIGANEDLHPVVVEVVYTSLSPMAPFIGSIGMFGEGPSGTLDEDAPTQLLLLDLSGRRP